MTRYSLRAKVEGWWHRLVISHKTLDLRPVKGECVEMDGCDGGKVKKAVINGSTDVERKSQLSQMVHSGCPYPTCQAMQ